MVLLTGFEGVPLPWKSTTRGGHIEGSTFHFRVQEGLREGSVEATTTQVDIQIGAAVNVSRHSPVSVTLWPIQTLSEEYVIVDTIQILSSH